MTPGQLTRPHVVKWRERLRPKKLGKLRIVHAIDVMVRRHEVPTQDGVINLRDCSLVEDGLVLPVEDLVRDTAPEQVAHEAFRTRIGKLLLSWQTQEEVP